MAKGIVYILTNPCLDGWVKIGMTERNDIEKRLRELNAPTNLPLSYRCYAVYEVEDPVAAEKRIHSLIDRVENSLHAREKLSYGRVREREFFRISPETAYGIFKDVASLRNDTENLKLRAPTSEQAEEEEIADNRTRRKNNSFQLLHIPVGEKISFLADENITAEVVDEKNKVRYKDKDYSVTALAQKLMIETQNCSHNIHLNGWRYFVKDGRTLSELRELVENEENE